jgi:hypothetical protein
MSEKAADTRPISASGNRPYALGEPHAERVLAIAMALAGEISVLREQFDTMLRIAGEKQLFSYADIEAYEPPVEVRAEREAWRRDYLRRVLRVLHDPATADMTAEEYRAFVKEIS